MFGLYESQNKAAPFESFKMTETSDLYNLWWPRFIRILMKMLQNIKTGTCNIA